MKKLLSTTAILLTLSGCGFEIVETGQRGVEVNLGEVVGEPLTEGLHFYNPLTSDIIQMSVMTEVRNIDSSAYTKDVQKANISLSVNFNLDPSSVLNTYKTVGKDWEAKLVSQAVPAIVKNVLGKYEAVQLISKRTEATQEIENMLIESLSRQGVIVTRFEITNISYDPAFENAVEAKVVAVQNAEAAVNKTKQVEEEAKQTEITATAFANGMKIKSDALAQNKSLVDYEAVQKWDGKLPQYMFGSTIPMINLDKLPK